MKRGKSDNLSDSDLQCLECDLETYINGKGTEALWDFRSYGTVQNIASGSVHAKMAPEISDLLQNADLWQLLLKYCPHAKLRDSDIMKCLNTLLKNNCLVSDSCGSLRSNPPLTDTPLNLAYGFPWPIRMRN